MIWDERSAQIQQTNNNIKLKMQMPVETQLGDLSNTTPDFICKLYAMIKYRHSILQQHPQTISFSEDGSEVHIHDKEKFTTQILKKTFRHDKWRSFIRQMNMYNFRKVNRGMQTYIFVNNIFREGNQTNFYKIKRKINTKEQQMSTQNNLQQDLKILLKLQSQSLGIINNTTLLQFDLNKNYEANSNRNSRKQALKFDNDNQISNLNGVNRLESLPKSQNTLPSLSIFENRILGNNVNYTNSIIYFIERAIKYRKQGEQLCGQIKQCMEYIAKERKTVQNKNILNTVKDSTQMIDEIANKFKQKIENYVDYKVSELQQNVQNFSNYLPNNSQENIGLNQNNNPPVSNGNFNIDLLEYISGHSFQNIPEPMSNRLYNPLMSPPTKIPQLSQVKLQDQQKKDSNFKIIKLQSKLNSKTLNNSGNIRLGNQTFSTSSINPIIPQPIPLINTRKQLNENKKSVSFQNNASINNNQNILGLTSQCSFSSLNLDKQ